MCSETVLFTEPNPLKRPAHRRSSHSNPVLARASFSALWLQASAETACDKFRPHSLGRGRLKCDGTRAEIRFRLSAKRTSPFKSVGASVQSTAGSRRVRISGSNAGYTMFRSSVKSTGYPLHSPISLSLRLPCVTVYHHISTGIYLLTSRHI